MDFERVDYGSEIEPNGAKERRPFLEEVRSKATPKTGRGLGQSP